MKTTTSTGRGMLPAAIAMVLVYVLGAVSASAQTEGKINLRPLTPREITDYGMTNTSQRTGGGPNAGIGQPIYIEALVKTGLVVSSVNFTLVGIPTNSAAALQTSPLPTNMPTYDFGERRTHFVAGRTMLKPDVPCTTYNGDFILRTQIQLGPANSNKVLTFTNILYGSTYIGYKEYLCTLCHASKIALYTNTAHATAFQEQITGEGSDHFQSFCISCHTLGYDATPGATNSGFDDIATEIGWTFPSSLNPTNWSGMNTNLQNKANVQCESCHGPADRHKRGLGDTNAIDISLSAGTCGQCHDSLPHHVKAYEWWGSMHATGYVYRFGGSCTPCHSAEGFIYTHDPDYSLVNSIPRATTNEGITCSACHDPHERGMGEAQLRNLPTATLSNGFVVTQGGLGTLCMNCHHARQNVAVGVLGAPSPHHGVQGDMLAGQNGYTYGLDMPSSRHLQAVTNSCVGCHMQLIPGTVYSNYNTMVGGHTFRISWDAGTTDPSDDVHVTEVCSACHVEANTFDFGGEDYDRDGSVEGVQSEIRGLLDRLALLLPPAGTGVTIAATNSLAERRAGWNYLFVVEDQSMGVHNPKYAAALLWASIQDLSGGIDADQDGLADTWEMFWFGNLTSQSGTGDADNDGVNNAAEENAGTNPTLADSDNDGFSDLAELQGGSQATNNLSILDTNTVMQMLPAIELGYVPGQMGITQRFETVDALGNGGTWTNVGSPFVTSNQFFYQLISLRDGTQKFYRVVKP
jgi:hypothetical protein